MDRIGAIRRSMRGFVWGLFGFCPVIGVLPGLYALVCWARVRSSYRKEWNPATAYLNWGAALAVIGLLNSGLLVVMVLLTCVFNVFN
jgi:hypothetical protein